MFKIQSQEPQRSKSKLIHAEKRFLNDKFILKQHKKNDKNEHNYIIYITFASVRRHAISARQTRMVQTFGMVKRFIH